MIGDRLKKYDDAIERNGFTAVLYLRLLNSPFTPMNYGLSLTKVRFWDYFFGDRIRGYGLYFCYHIFERNIKRRVGLRHVGKSGFIRDLFCGHSLYFFPFLFPMILKRVKGRLSNSK